MIAESIGQFKEKITVALFTTGFLEGSITIKRIWMTLLLT
jgi:hypothetical protein